MIESYQNGVKLNQKEAKKNAISIAMRYHNITNKDKWNDGGWPENMGEKISVTGIEHLYQLLVDNGPVYAYYNNPNTGDAHLVVVTGVNLYKGIVYTNNPWGVKGKQSYEQFLNGVAKHWYQGNLGMKFVEVIPVK